MGLYRHRLFSALGYFVATVGYFVAMRGKALLGTKGIEASITVL
jgi:hypothetical protein